MRGFDFCGGGGYSQRHRAKTHTTQEGKEGNHVRACDGSGSGR